MLKLIIRAIPIQSQYHIQFITQHESIVTPLTTMRTPLTIHTPLTIIHTPLTIETPIHTADSNSDHH